MATLPKPWVPPKQPLSITPVHKAQYNWTNMFKSSNGNLGGNLTPAGGNPNNKLPSKGGASSNKNAFKRAQKSAWKIYQNQLKDMNASYGLNLQGMQNQLNMANQGYEDSARQAYITNQQQNNGLNNYLASRGYTGGMTESSRINLGNNYQNNLNDIRNTQANNQTQYDMMLAQHNADQASAQNELRNTYEQNILKLRAKYNVW